MDFSKWLDLQLFAGEGAGDGAGAGDSGSGAETGVEAADPGRQRLLALGVPESKIREKASKQVSRQLTQGEAQTGEPAQEESAVPQEDAHTEEENQGKPSWDDLMKDPEYRERMQETVQARLRTAKAAEETLGKMAPALELLARKYGQDPESLDYDALAKAISDDDSYYENKAMEMGVSIETAKKMDQIERDNARYQREEAMSLERQKVQNHIRSLQEQAETLRQIYPGFDLRKELENPDFSRLVSPNVNVPVKDAYFAVHADEIQRGGMQVAAQKTAEKMSKAIQSGSMRPRESGAANNTPSVATFDYKHATKEQRQAFKQRILDAAARGEKIYPGM